jgi:hypothetical protein
MRIGVSWRMFRRMQDSLALAAALIYAALAINAWQVLPGASALKAQRTLFFPAFFFVLSLVTPLLIGPVRKALTGHLWVSYRTGFGQSVTSVLGGVAVLLAFGGFILWQIRQGAIGGRFPSGAFSGYAAGAGLLLAQTILVRRIEADPNLRRQIEEP